MSKPSDAAEDAALAERGARTSFVTHTEDDNPHIGHIESDLTRMNQNISKAVSDWYNSLGSGAETFLAELKEKVNATVLGVQTDYLIPMQIGLKTGAQQAYQDIDTAGKCLHPSFEGFQTGINKAVSDTWNSWAEAHPDAVKQLTAADQDAKSYLDSLNASISQHIQDAQASYTKHQEECHKQCEEEALKK